jgi:hypothetical protein
MILELKYFKRIESISVSEGSYVSSETDLNKPFRIKCKRGAEINIELDVDKV